MILHCLCNNIRHARIQCFRKDVILIKLFIVHKRVHP